MIRKGQVYNIGGQDIQAQSAFVATLFKVAARNRRLQLPRMYRVSICNRTEITTAMPVMAARGTERINFDIVRRHVEEIVATGEVMREAARWLWFEIGVAVDLSGAATIAALRSRRVRSEAGRKTCALVCGAGSDGIQ